MSTKQKVIVVASSAAILLSLVFVIRFAGFGPGSSRSSALQAVQADLTADDLIVRRSDLIYLIENARENPATLPERLESAEKNLEAIEKKLEKQGVDVASLEVQPNWRD